MSLKSSAFSNDSTFEKAEDFKLTATYTSGASRTADGVATIVDDGTGTNYTGTITSGSPTTNTTNLNDDRTLTVTGYGPVNEGSQYAIHSHCGIWLLAGPELAGGHLRDCGHTHRLYLRIFNRRHQLDNVRRPTQANDTG